MRVSTGLNFHPGRINASINYRITQFLANHLARKLGQRSIVTGVYILISGFVFVIYIYMYRKEMINNFLSLFFYRRVKRYTCVYIYKHTRVCVCVFLNVVVPIYETNNTRYYIIYSTTSFIGR